MHSGGSEMVTKQHIGDENTIYTIALTTACIMFDLFQIMCSNDANAEEDVILAWAE